MEKPVNRDKLRQMLDLLEHDHWSSSSPGSQAAVDSMASEQPAEEECLRRNSLGSFSSGVDIKVRNPFYLSNLPHPAGVSHTCCGSTGPALVTVCIVRKPSMHCSRVSYHIQHYAAAMSFALVLLLWRKDHD